MQSCRHTRILSLKQFWRISTTLYQLSLEKKKGAKYAAESATFTEGFSLVGCAAQSVQDPVRRSHLDYRNPKGEHTMTFHFKVSDRDIPSSKAKLEACKQILGIRLTWSDMGLWILQLMIGVWAWTGLIFGPACHGHANQMLTTGKLLECYQKTSEVLSRHNIQQARMRITTTHQTFKTFTMIHLQHINQCNQLVSIRDSSNYYQDPVCEHPQPLGCKQIKNKEEIYVAKIHYV